MAGTLTRLQMANEVLDNMGRASTAATRSGSTLASRAVTWLDRASLRIARKESLLFTEATASTVADQKTYALPSNLRQLISIRLENGNNSRKLNCLMPREFDRMYPKPDQETTAAPDWYVWVKNTLTFELFRIPDAVYTMRLRYGYWPSLLSTDASTSDFTHMDDVLIYLATADGFRWLQELVDASSWHKRGMDALEDALKAERDLIPDWAPQAAGFTTSPPYPIGDYWNEPFAIRDPGGNW